MAVLLSTDKAFRRAPRAMEFRAPGTTAMAVWEAAQETGELARCEAWHAVVSRSTRGSAKPPGIFASQLGQIIGETLFTRDTPSEVPSGSPEATLRDLLQEVGQGTHTESPRLTLCAYREKWYEMHRQGLSPTTDRRYLDSLRVHIIPHLGDMTLQKITVSQFRASSTSCFEMVTKDMVRNDPSPPSRSETALACSDRR